jgi:ABC-type nitrate/sulfonate/bicarbonate transport system permease component
MEHSIFLDFLTSLQLLFVGFIPAAIFGVLIGSFLGINNIVYQIFKWVLQIPHSIPPIVFLPLALVVFKETESAAIMIVFFSAIWSITTNTATGIRQCRKHSNNRIAIERIFYALRMGVSVAWFTAIATEMLIGTKGLGVMIWNGYKSGNYHYIIEGIIYIGVIGFLLDRLLEITGNILTQLVSEGEKSNL